MDFEKRTVYGGNFRQEFQEMLKLLRRNEVSYVSVDTEFPGTVFKPAKPYYEMSVEETYGNMRVNVNNLNLIQLGLSVCDHHKESTKVVWEFNFKDFDFEKDRSDPSSIDLLKDHGVDFVRNREEGISGADFAKEFNGFQFSCLNLTWVFFHCTYDLGYLIKILTQKPLPESADEFMRLVQMYLGRNVFDVKEMVKSRPFEWSCGLNKVAQNLEVERAGGESHQAGSDSLLTLRCFLAVFDFLQHRHPALAGKMWEFWNYQLYGFRKLQLKRKHHLHDPRLVAHLRLRPFVYPQPRIVTVHHHLPVAYPPHFVYPQPVRPRLVTNTHSVYPQFVATV